jgi:hypothetical protein
VWVAQVMMMYRQKDTDVGYRHDQEVNNTTLPTPLNTTTTKH